MQFVKAEREDLVSRIFVQCLRLAEMQDGLVGPAEFGESEPKIAMRYVISLGDAQGVAPKGFTIAPVANLPIGETSHNQDHEDGGAGEPSPEPEPGGHRPQSPYQSDEQADKRDVGVAVGHGLLANSDDADHRDQST